MKHSRTRIRQSFFARRVVGHWNGLPENVVTAESLESFEARLDRHYTGRGWCMNTQGNEKLEGWVG